MSRNLVIVFGAILWFAVGVVTVGHLLDGNFLIVAFVFAVGLSPLVLMWWRDRRRGLKAMR